MMGKASAKQVENSFNKDIKDLSSLASRIMNECDGDCMNCVLCRSSNIKSNRGSVSACSLVYEVSIW